MEIINFNLRPSLSFRTMGAFYHSKSSSSSVLLLRENLSEGYPYRRSSNQAAQQVLKFCCLFLLRFNATANNFQSCRDGATASRVLPVLLGSKVSCSRTQHGGDRFRTPDHSLWSPSLLLSHRTPLEICKWKLELGIIEQQRHYQPALLLSLSSPWLFPYAKQGGYEVNLLSIYANYITKYLHLPLSSL